MNIELYIQLLTPHPLSTREEADKIFQLWEGLIPEYLPQKCGNSEPVDLTFDLRNRESLFEHWRWPFLAVRRNPRMEASIWMRKNGLLQHAVWNLVFRFTDVDVDVLKNFLKIAAVELNADFGCLTVLTPLEIYNGQRNGTVLSLNKQATRFNFGVTSKMIHNSLPDLYWMTIFGPPYIEMFGRDKLERSPAATVEMLGKEVIALQITPSIDEVISGPSDFESQKKNVKKHLGESSFFPINNSCNVIRPDFAWK